MEATMPYPIEESTSGTMHATVLVAPVKVQNVRVGYPIRGNWWTGCANWTHMATGVHSGKYPIEWLKQLTNAELQSLHSDDHENKVNWNYIRQFTNSRMTKTSSVEIIPSNFYPDGRCPLQR